ncbi:MAG: response regulator transcription factor [Cytophagales bacterium]|nr:response regulator transcription factor [Armatimonadota bacterium]
MQSPAHIVGEVSERLKRIRYRSEAVRALLPPTGEDALREGVQALVEECERSQTETLELLLHTSITSPDPRRILTPREREVALLLVEGKTNRQIAEQLFVSEKTAKTHVSSIIRKLSAGGRSGVAQLLKPSGGSSTPSM